MVGHFRTEVEVTFSPQSTLHDLVYHIRAYEQGFTTTVERCELSILQDSEWFVSYRKFNDIQLNYQGELPCFKVYETDDVIAILGEIPSRFPFQSPISVNIGKT